MVRSSEASSNLSTVLSTFAPSSELLLDVSVCDGYICHGYMPPLTPAVVHVLMALAGGTRHGYAIAKDVRRLTDNRITLGPGTLSERFSG